MQGKMRLVGCEKMVYFIMVVVTADLSTRHIRYLSFLRVVVYCSNEVFAKPILAEISLLIMHSENSRVTHSHRIFPDQRYEDWLSISRITIISRRASHPQHPCRLRLRSRTLHHFHELSHQDHTQKEQYCREAFLIPLSHVHMATCQSKASLHKR